MANQSHSMVDLAKTRIARRYSALKADFARLFTVFPHLRFGSAVSPAMPDGVEEPMVRPLRRHYRTAATQKKTVSPHMKNLAARARGRGPRKDRSVNLALGVPRHLPRSRLEFR
jgi:hypothetical protein